ncbi:methylenetetrahydrofolate reductase [NAD(P)H] [Caproiciproducens galactitolivorans]|uniref:Methylenetetrahydrofolate reductase n=1 Tax=Caproiciproducens galactitolivorans TaxID=642589 RepID=A0A4Z0YAI4_9FIRM|nr:methylenetetrahydrofolate reductase [NAD(P)H] [Caproiciproducens galactitolivorans]QEY35245.1 methylenetetrahydrofolate reductase [NAD(P)H] [Caproiciproducens galactitolivorans]TGJ76938.1 5,10-methylenetetrahydrofolate reductase [Caproiciproducens galactitolivorans]
MKISECLKSGRVTVSCELFPPKKDGELEHVREVVRDMAALKPNFMSVTYGAGGGTSENTVRIAQEIESRGITALAHLTCVSSTKDQVARILAELKEKRIENILALRGDIPKDSDFPSPGHYRYACELVAEIKAHGGFCIGAACYPEGHIECAHKEDDIEYLKRKVESGCDFLTTQMFFDNNILYNFLYRILAKGINVPVVAGIMPVTNSRQIKRICALSGTVLPPRFKAIVDKFSDRPAAMEQAGIAYATEQIVDLISNNVKNIHIYTMNKPDVAARIMGNLSEIIG